MLWLKAVRFVRHAHVLVGVLTVVLLAMPVSGGAQVQIPRIGVLRIGAPADASTDIFRQTMRDLGYLEGQTITIEYRWAEGRLDRLPELAAELVRLKVDVIVAGGVAGVRAAKQATSSIPIVMEAATDPLGAGLIASLARPGGNITGSATLFSELGAKRLELFKEAFPKATRVAVLYDPTTSRSVLTEIQGAADRLKVRLRVLEVQAPEDLDGAVADAEKWHANVLCVLGSPFFGFQRVRIAHLATAHGLATIVPRREYVEAGALMAYGPDFGDLYRRAATFVHKILKGAKPADLPIEQPTKFELVINLKTAKALGLTIPPSLLQRADQVIE
jgi:putative ABC transport system substrate-binding protein